MVTLLFFVALFGALYYGFKWATDKGKAEYETHKTENLMNSVKRYQSRYGADFTYQNRLMEKILSGNFYDEICQKYEEDFEFVYGSNWKSRLLIPPIGIYNNPGNMMRLPTPDIDWVYHLMLADEGKLDYMSISPVEGYPCGGIDSIDTNIKFVQCIERRLIRYGINDVRFVVKPDNSCWAKNPWEPVPKPYSKKEMCGGRFVIEALADKEYTDRIW